MHEVKKPKKPLISYYIIAFLLLMMFNFMFMPWMSQQQIKDVDYGRFVSMTENKKIDTVEIQQDENEIMLRSKTAILFTEPEWWKIRD